jgi:hypothetical protein
MMDVRVFMKNESLVMIEAQSHIREATRVNIDVRSHTR